MYRGQNEIITMTIKTYMSRPLQSSLFTEETVIDNGTNIPSLVSVLLSHFRLHRKRVYTDVCHKLLEMQKDEKVVICYYCVFINSSFITIFIYLFLYSFIIHPYIYLLIPIFIYSYIHWFIYSSCYFFIEAKKHLKRWWWFPACCIAIAFQRIITSLPMIKADLPSAATKCQMHRLIVIVTLQCTVFVTREWFSILFLCSLELLFLGEITVIAQSCYKNVGWICVHC